MKTLPTITVTRTFESSAEELFAASRKIEELAGEMPNITKVTILERSDDRAVSRWEGRIEVAGMSRDLVWEEQDIWDNPSLTVRFNQTKGDLKVYSGVLKIVARGPETAEAEITVNYDLGIPFLSGLLLKVLDKIVRDNANLYLDALGKVARAREP